MKKKMRHLFLNAFLFLLLSGCANQDVGKVINPYAFKKVDGVQLESMYRDKALGKIVLSADWSLGSKGYVVINSFAVGGRVAVGYLASNEAVEFYLPENIYDLILNPQEKKSLMMNVGVKSGETTYLKWSDTAALPLKVEHSSSSAKIIASGTPYYMHEINAFIYKVEQSKKPNVDFSIQKIGNYSANLRVFLYNQELIKTLKINGEEIRHPGRNLEVVLNKDLKVGENQFELEALTHDGELIKKSVYAKKYTAQEEKNISLNEQKFKADLMRQENQKLAAEERRKKIEEDRVVKEGDGTPDDLMCKRYGLKPQTASYTDCRMKLDFARTENARQQQQYEREQAEYEKRVAEIQREREKQRAMRQLELGLRMMGGQSLGDAVNSVGTGAPIAPSRPSPVTQTITLPNGRMINCTTFGTITNCF